LFKALEVTGAADDDAADGAAEEALLDADVLLTKTGTKSRLFKVSTTVLLTVVLGAGATDDAATGAGTDTGATLLDTETGAADELTGATDELTGATDELTGATDELTGATDELTGAGAETSAGAGAAVLAPEAFVAFAMAAATLLGCSGEQFHLR
jgi:hypothetical protein